MEVGAVKQAFNNEVILLKKRLNQAKIQIIHKLTRRAKTFAEKKVPDKIKEKLKKKAESAVREVMIMKKVKARDIARFIVTHSGELKDFLNKPIVDQDKVCARLLLHKSLQDKYKFIRDRFSNVPINDLFMSRQERRKMKQEEKEKQMNKKKAKKSPNKSASKGWEVEDIEMDSKIKDDLGPLKESEADSSNELDESEASGDSSIEESDDSEMDANLNVEQDNDSNEEDNVSETGKFVKNIPKQKVQSKSMKSQDNIEFELKPRKKPEVKLETTKKPEVKHKDNNKNKNLNEKILLKKFKKDKADDLGDEKKVVDPFFITSTGENYMSVVEPRQPDEIKDVHKQGNRKHRRAVMFGHVPRAKPRRFDDDNKRHHDSKNDQQNGYERNSGSRNNSFNDKFNHKSNDRINTKNNNSFNSKSRNVPPFAINADEKKDEKLHPSWEAKKKQSGILPFQGKKIVFDES